ncbi:hypothetical protein E4K10_47615 [Streptomyces sp. T1317-0309]|nr:hypothetical protein E4K10_47615 [Streptomyces sp. T1317-0309]
MDDDWLSSSSRRSVTVTDSQKGEHPDSDQLAGSALETTAYTGVGGTVDHSTVTSYWISAATATRARPGMPALTAHATKLPKPGPARPSPTAPPSGASHRRTTPTTPPPRTTTSGC